MANERLESCATVSVVKDVERFFCPQCKEVTPKRKPGETWRTSEIRNTVCEPCEQELEAARIRHKENLAETALLAEQQRLRDLAENPDQSLSADELGEFEPGQQQW
jgi:RNase P subunit RPR2